jgi:16S rRNA (guanine966-N2)-methyltransferase
MTRVIAGSAGGRRLSVPAGRDTRPTSDRAREGLFGTIEALHGPLVGANVLDLYAGSGAVGLEALSRGAARALLVEADQRAVKVIRANIAALGLPGATVAADRVERVLSSGPPDTGLPEPGLPETGLPDTGLPETGLPETGPPEPGPPETGPPETAVSETSASEPGPPEPGPPETGAPGTGAPGSARFDVVFADPPYVMPGAAVTAILADLAGRDWLVEDALVVVERSTRSGPVDWPAGFQPDRSRRYGEATLWYGLATGARQA